MVLQVLLSAPTWLLLAVGVVYGLMMRRSHPRVSTLASTALAGFLALDFFGTIVSQVYLHFVLPSGGGGGIQGLAVRGFYLVQAAMHGLLLALAITAATFDRKLPDEQ